MREDNESRIYISWVTIVALFFAVVSTLVCIDLATRVARLERAKSDAMEIVEVWKQSYMRLEQATVEFSSAIVGGDQRWKTQ